MGGGEVCQWEYGISQNILEPKFERMLPRCQGMLSTPKWKEGLKHFSRKHQYLLGIPTMGA